MSVSRMVTTTLRHYGQGQPDRSRHWDSIRPVLMTAFAHEGARDFRDEAWLQKNFECSTMKRTEYCKDKDVV